MKPTFTATRIEKEQVRISLQFATDVDRSLSVYCGSDIGVSAQFVIHPRHIAIHWYKMSDDDMDALVAQLCHQGGLVVYDPQLTSLPTCGIIA